MSTTHERDINELCPLPDPEPHPPTRFCVPAGAVDTHAHVIGTDYVATRSYTPAPAPGEAYIRMLDAVGMTHGVLIQVSVHGTDNRVMLDVLRQHPKRLRGVAVIPPDLSESGLRELKDAGVVGLRLATMMGGAVGMTNLDRYEAICRELGWHLQFYTDARKLAEVAPQLSRLRVPYVFDHMGHVLAADGVGSPGARLVLDLVKDGAWVKLAGAFRVSATPPYTDTTPVAQALLAAAPDRCVWGSDWPHVGFWANPTPNVGDQLDLLAEWAGDATRRDAVLVANPHRLYGFAD